jgi:hypothetical protein
MVWLDGFVLGLVLKLWDIWWREKIDANNRRRAKEEDTAV